MRGLGIHAGQQYDEFLAAEPRDHLAGTGKHVPERIGYPLQALVALRMAVVVVVTLEKIHVAHQHGQGLAETHRAAEFDFLDFVEMPAIGQAGQRVTT